MDVTSLCSRLMVAVMVLLVAQINQSHSAQNAGGVFPRITPDRLQFFEYETVHISCEKLMGLAGWRVMHRHNKPTNSDICTPPASSCTIQSVFERHSGEYWCEEDEGNTTGSIKISVTDGSVILEVPARPVMEGSDVTLSCRKQNSESEHVSDFYKDGVFLGTVPGHMTIRNVSKSHEGLYSCSISGAAQSPESRLAVRKKKNEPDKEIQTFHDNTPHPGVFVGIAVSISLTVIFLFVLGFFLCQKHQVSCKSTPGSHSQEENKVSRADSVADPLHATYAAVKKTNKRAGYNSDVTYAEVESFRRKNVRSSAGTQPSLMKETAIYSFISTRSFSQN